MSQEQPSTTLTFWKPFHSKEDFYERDMRINRAVGSAILSTAGGLLIGALVFKGRTMRGFVAGSFGMYTINKNIQK